MKKIMLTLVSVILVFVGLQAQVYAISEHEYDMTDSLRLIDKGTSDLNGYGTFTHTGSSYFNKQYKYMLLTKTSTIVNTSNSTMKAQLYLPYYYAYGLNDTDNTSYVGIGYPANWNSESNKFLFDNYVSNGAFINSYDSDIVSLNYPLRKDLKNSEYFIDDLVYQQGELADWSQSVPVVRQLASESPDDTVIAFDMGTLAPGESKTFSYVIKSYGLQHYSGVSGVDFITYLRFEVAAKPVMVHYVDQFGNTIADDSIINGNGEQLVNETYNTIAKDIDGYQLIETTDNTSGTLSDQEQTVTYTYQKVDKPVNGEVTVNYKDIDGNALCDAIILSDVVGATYKTDARTFSGWTLKTVEGNAEGIYAAEPQQVSYIYEPEAATNSEIGMLPNTGNNHDFNIVSGAGTFIIAGAVLAIMYFKRK
ncbi:MucBP domain-containing protein [Culicoidibacter larvae]|uniref:MucBP domain-containing protein n=1 Tax=Culicoidibacter larvae TaxID=2579976 RepID=A0A5R8Q7Z2_9FIRM|nr:MucBP domain-containing protein [Culicoidibacter larvae]TLG71517.1 hypothetical protein FEZ08_10505 [Culicoidibacter larvae]